MKIYSLPSLSILATSCLMAASMLSVAACGGDSSGSSPFTDSDQSDPWANGDDEGFLGDDDDADQGFTNAGADAGDELMVCEDETDCNSDEACTQGGHCVNITGERSATAALQADLNDLPEAAGIGHPYDLPPNATLRINDLSGDGVGLKADSQVMIDGKGSLLVVDNDTIGVQLTMNAAWSRIRDLRIDSQNPNAKHDGIGIDIRAHGARLDNIYFWRLGTGVRAHTTVNEEVANINSQQWSNLVFDGNHNHAVDIRGGDANAGVLSGLQVIDGAGIYDRSFLGNTHVGPNTTGAHTHSVTTDSDAGRNLILGAHIAEDDEDPRAASMNDLYVGGNAVARVEGSGERVGDGASYLRFKDRDGNLEVHIPAHKDSPISWKHGDEEQRWFLRYWDHPSLQKWGFSYQNSSASPFFWTGQNHPEGGGLLEIDEE